jgi:hypothetical protein
MSIILLIINIVDTKPVVTDHKPQPQLNLVQLGPGIEYQCGLDHNGKPFSCLA